MASHSFLMNTYSRQNIAFSHGSGVWLWDTEGRRYLDALSGIAVNGLGHNHPRLVKAIAGQAARVIHTSNLFQVPEQEALAQRLCELSGMREAFFCNSGAEANEAAIKIARRYAHQRGNDAAQIIVMDRAWHGRTLATLAATDSDKAKQGFGELPGGFVRTAYRDLDAVRQAGEREPGVVAVLLEVLQGEGGIREADIDYLRGLRALCSAHGWLLMVDEVQSGIGRTGAWFAYQHAGIMPDVITLAKGLGSGVPIGACLAGGAATGVMQPGSHGTTFGGGPLVSVAALETLSIMADDGLLANAAAIGNYLLDGLSSALQGMAGVKDIRGHGLMIGIELDRPCVSLIARGLERSVIINVTRENVVRLLPPLIFSRADADVLLTELKALIGEFLDE